MQEAFVRSAPDYPKKSKKNPPQEAADFFKLRWRHFKMEAFRSFGGCTPDALYDAIITGEKIKE